MGGRGKEIPVENLSDKVNIPDAEKCQPILVKAKGVSESYQDKCDREECTKSESRESLAQEKSGGITQLTQTKSVKLLQRQKKTKKTGDILFIDLTADEITEKVIKKKKKIRKHHWLTEAKKKLKKKVGKLSEKKKKIEENLATNNLSQDFTFLDLTDSTSARNLSTITTPEFETASTDLVLAKSLSMTITPKPENHVTSNFVDNYFDLGSDAANSVEKQSTCVVTTTTTTTFTEPVVAVSNASTTCANAVSNEAIQLGENSCHTTHEPDEISAKKQDACTIGEFSNGLSHICESYDSDSVNDSAENSTKWDEKTGENSRFESKEVSSTEANDSLKDSELQRSLSESSEVAVIFTRRASDVDIVDLDSYSEENGETQSSDMFAKLETGTEDKKEQLEDEIQRKKSVSDDLLGLNSDIEHLTLHNGQQEFLRIGETLQAMKDSVKHQGIDEKDKKWEKIVKQKRNGSIKNENLKECEKITGAKIDIWTGDNSITIVNKEPKSKNFTKIEPQEESNARDYRVEENTFEKLAKFETVDYRNGENHCDHRSNKGDQLDDVESQPSRELKIAKREDPNFADGEVPNVGKELTEERTPIPKINEIVICPKNVDNNVCNTSNDLLRVEEPRFNENIDGLSLLASVSQHVSHLKECSEKTLSKPKIINGEAQPIENGLKIYSPNVNGPNVEGSTEEVFGTRNSYKLFLDLNAESSNETINEIFGVPRQLSNEDKTNVDEPKSKSHELYDKNSSEIVPLILETTVDLSSNKLQNNVISVENVTQIIKDSANVIVNGEMVVLFQKSPNSNLYIINNKAVDGEEKKIVKKNVERTSTAMRDIINHIPINPSEKNAEGLKIHRTSKGFFPMKNKTLVKKLDNSEKKYENQLLSKQFQPSICEEKFHPYVDKLDGDYIKKEILNNDSYEDEWRQRCTDLSGSVIELQPVKKSPSPVVRPADTPINLKTHRGEESGALNMVTTGRSNGKFGSKKREDKSKGMLNKTLTYKQNIKQEFTSCVNDTPDKISCCYGGQISSNDSKQLALQNFPSGFNTGHFIPANPLDSQKIPHVYSTVTTATNLFSCDYSSCSLKVSSSQSYQSVPPPIPNCQLSHCACLKCAYDIHCREYVEHSTTVADSSYLQTNSYYLPADSSIKNCTIQKQDLNVNEATLAKLHDDELLHNIEQSIIDDKQASGEIAEVKTVPEGNYKLEFENKLPLKKRLKSHAMLSMSYEEVPTKIQKVENYPGTPMMSIAALEAGSESKNTGNLYNEKAVSSTSPEMDPEVKDDSCHQAREMIRRDYLKDTSLTSIGNCANVDDRIRNAAAGCQRSFKTMAQRKEMTVPVACSLKRVASGTASNPKSPKLLKKTKTVSTKCRQTRSSKRNIPKVDYSYDGIVDIDPKWNASNELKRKRKKTNR